MADTTSLQRLDRLIQRLLTSGEARRRRQVGPGTETALDVLAVDPTNAQAQIVDARERRSQWLGSGRPSRSVLRSRRLHAAGRCRRARDDA